MKLFNTLTNTNIKTLSETRETYLNSRRKRRIPFKEHGENILTVVFDKEGYTRHFIGKQNGDLVEIVIKGRQRHKFHEILICRSTAKEQFKAIHDIIFDDINQRLFVINKGPELRIFRIGNGYGNVNLLGILDYSEYFFKENEKHRHMVLVYPYKEDANILKCLFNDGNFLMAELNKSDDNQLSLWQMSLQNIFSLLFWKKTAYVGIHILDDQNPNMELNMFSNVNIDTALTNSIEKATYTQFGPLFIIEENLNTKKVVVLNEMDQNKYIDDKFMPTSLIIDFNEEIQQIKEINDENGHIDDLMLKEKILVELHGSNKSTTLEISNPDTLLSSHLQNTDKSIFNECISFIRFRRVALGVINGNTNNEDSNAAIVSFLLNKKIFKEAKMKDDEESVEMMKLKNPTKEKLEEYMHFSDAYNIIEEYHNKCVGMVESVPIINLNGDLNGICSCDIGINQLTLKVVLKKLKMINSLLNIYLPKFEDERIYKITYQMIESIHNCAKMERLILHDMKFYLDKWIKYLTILEFLQSRIKLNLNKLPLKIIKKLQNIENIKAFNNHLKKLENEEDEASQDEINSMQNIIDWTMVEAFKSKCKEEVKELFGKLGDSFITKNHRLSFESGMMLLQEMVNKNYKKHQNQSEALCGLFMANYGYGLLFGLDVMIKFKDFLGISDFMKKFIRNEENEGNISLEIKKELAKKIAAFYTVEECKKGENIHDYVKKVYQKKNGNQIVTV